MTVMVMVMIMTPMIMRMIVMETMVILMGMVTLMTMMVNMVMTPMVLMITDHNDMYHANEHGNIQQYSSNTGRNPSSPHRESAPH